MAGAGRDGLTYAEKITAGDREVKTSGTAREVHNQVRGLTPHIGARFALEGDDRLGNPPHCGPDEAGGR